MNKKAVTILIICISAAVIITIIALVSCSHRNAEPAVTSEEGSVEETTSETSTEESSSETSKTTSATTTTTTEGTTTSELAAEETTDSTTSGTTTTSTQTATVESTVSTTTAAATTTTTEAEATTTTTTESATAETTTEATTTTTAAYVTSVDVKIHIEYITDWESGAYEDVWYTVHNVDPYVNWGASDTKAKDALVAEYGLDRDAISDIHEKTVVAYHWSDGSTT